jgi:magnesium chelatase family protein
VLSSTIIGVDAHLVEVEVDITAGLPAFTTVGLPETAVRESKERVKSAIQNSGYEFPADRITVNLAPAGIKKEGTGFDLPMAIGILSATTMVPQQGLERYLFMGELSLDGRVKPVGGSLPLAICARQSGFEGIIVPYGNRKEAAVVSGISVIAVQTLSQVVEFLNGTLSIAPEPFTSPDRALGEFIHELDFSEVKGQEHVKRALEVASAGGHNVIMIGPPGSGKTMLARRIPSILPPISFEEALETTKIYSVMGMLKNGEGLVADRPFRSPHHTISDAGLIGGGKFPRPGEVSLAHNGVLFLDELPEFKKHVLEVLRQPLENHQVTISRASSSITYPSSFMLVAAMNPCPCGYFSDPKHECSCSPQTIERYRSKISGPLMDRIDIHIEVPAVPVGKLTSEDPAEPSADIRSRVSAARSIQMSRFARSRIFCNAQMGSRHIKTHCRLDSQSRQLLDRAVDMLGLSARAFHKILKIARTISDLVEMDQIHSEQIMEAIQYRNLDRHIKAF